MKTWPLWVLVLLAACQPDFIDQWEVTKPRLMVAKLTIDGDTEGRTRPRAGESFTIRYFMMSPEKPQESYDFDLATCVGSILPDGTLACFGREQLERLQELIASEFGIEIDLGSQLDLPFEVEPYAGNDQLVVRLTLPPLPENLPPELNADRLATFGTFCVDGRVQRDPDKDVSDPISEVFQCVDNEGSDYQTALPFTMSVLVDVGQPGALNHHPSFECDASEPESPCNAGAPIDDDGDENDDDQLVPGAFVLQRPKKVVDEEGGERVLAWPAWDSSEPLPWDDCASAPDSLPKVRAETGDYTVQLRLDASDREDYERTIEENGEPVTEMQREELIFSHAITTRGGGLSTYAQALERELDDADAVLDFEYTPPRQHDEGDEGHIPESGRLVRFYFALRDQRGGTDFATRELCLLPPED
jgi:hypothetical protein